MTSYELCVQQHVQDTNFHILFLMIHKMIIPGELQG